MKNAVLPILHTPSKRSFDTPLKRGYFFNPLSFRERGQGGEGWLFAQVDIQVFPFFFFHFVEEFVKIVDCNFAGGQVAFF